MKVHLEKFPKVSSTKNENAQSFLRIHIKKEVLCALQLLCIMLLHWAVIMYKCYFKSIF